MVDKVNRRGINARIDLGRAEDEDDISSLSTGITDEEFADEFLAYPANPREKGARYQFNFLGAELEKTDAARPVRGELKKQP